MVKISRKARPESLYCQMEITSPEYDTEMCCLCDTLFTNRLHHYIVDCTANEIGRNALLSIVDNNSHCLHLLFDANPSMFVDVLLGGNMDTFRQKSLSFHQCFQIYISYCEEILTLAVVLRTCVIYLQTCSCI